MADKFMQIPYDDTQNYPFSRLQLVVETFVHSTSMKIYQSPRLLSKRIRKRYHKTLGTVINSSISPPSLLIISCVYYIYLYVIYVYILLHMLCIEETVNEGSGGGKTKLGGQKGDVTRKRVV